MISGTQSGLPCSASTTRTGKTLSLDRKPHVPVSPIHRRITGFMPFGQGLSASLAYLEVTILATVHMRSSCPSNLVPGPPDAGSSCHSLAVWTAPKGRVHCSRRFRPGRCAIPARAGRLHPGNEWFALLSNISDSNEQSSMRLFTSHAYRFNHRFRLKTLPMRLLVAALETGPRPEPWFRMAEELC